MWRHAIPRNDCLLQVTDFVYEQPFKPHLVSKTWAAYRNGHVLVSMPRSTLLVNDAVSMRFLECLAYLSKQLENRTWPPKRQLVSPPKKNSSCVISSSENPDMVQDSAMPSVPMWGDNCMNETKFQKKAGPSAAAGPPTSYILFDEPSLVCLPSKS